MLAPGTHQDQPDSELDRKSHHASAHLTLGGSIGAPQRRHAPLTLVPSLHEQAAVVTLLDFKLLNVVSFILGDSPACVCFIFIGGVSGTCCRSFGDQHC
jgi:hypothetical protein